MPRGINLRTERTVASHRPLIGSPSLFSSRRSYFTLAAEGGATGGAGGNDSGDGSGSDGGKDAAQGEGGGDDDEGGVLGKIQRWLKDPENIVSFVSGICGTLNDDGADHTK